MRKKIKPLRARTGVLEQENISVEVRVNKRKKKCRFRFWKNQEFLKQYDFNLHEANHQYNEMVTNGYYIVGDEPETI